MNISRFQINEASPLGVMQGRLLPKYQGRYQAHPVGNWEREFSIASELGLGCIEFILDFNDASSNPLLKPGGISQIQQIAKMTGVSVRSICADYFMEAPLHSSDPGVSETSTSLMYKLIENASVLGVTDVVLPCVDQSSLNGDDAMERFCERLVGLVAFAETRRLNIALETDLAPRPFAQLLDKLKFPNLTVNYDTGNSASLGFSVKEEFGAYGSRISDVHIKDRVLHGGSVELGTGNTNFDAFFELLCSTKYTGPVILQAYRDDEGVQIFRRQLDWLKEKYVSL